MFILTNFSSISGSHATRAFTIKSTSLTLQSEASESSAGESLLIRLGLIRAYAYAGVISSGPWVLSIIGILIIGIFSLGVVVPDLAVTRFQVTVTYLIAGSLILTGVVQLAFTRFCADRSFEHREDMILPNFGGVTVLVTLISGCLSLLIGLFLFPGQSILYRVLLVASFVVLSNIWIATVFQEFQTDLREQRVS